MKVKKFLDFELDEINLSLCDLNSDDEEKEAEVGDDEVMESGEKDGEKKEGQEGEEPKSEKKEGTENPEKHEIYHAESSEGLKMSYGHDREWK